MVAMPWRLGTAGWAIPRAHASAFPAEGSGLARYAARFDAVEINSSFHRSHRPGTYAHWAETVPDGFRFAVKMPKAITHQHRLVAVAEPLDRFLSETAALGARRGPLLVQLPPSLRFDAETAGGFFRDLRERTDASVACEPRHPSWFTSGADALLVAWRVARVAADPAPAGSEAAGEPGGWPDLVYHRLHGSPRMYWSAYDRAFLGRLSRGPRAPSRGRPGETWCVFDNTASGAAAGNALELRERLAAALPSDDGST